MVGVDFGTLSGRAVVASLSDGAVLGEAVHEYAHGVIDSELPVSHVPLDDQWALQHPGDYLDVLRTAVPDALAAAGCSPDEVLGVGIDFTSCTMLPTTGDGTPLCLLEEFSAEPHAWVKLWKHHAAQPEADLINAVAAERNELWLERYGGRYSSEWFFAKSLQILRDSPSIYRAADRLIEAADWLVWRLTGVETRNACTAGYKAMVQDGEFPSMAYFAALHPDFASVVDDKMQRSFVALGDQAGELTAEAAGWTGLLPGTPVAVANVDAHVTAPAVGVTGPGRMVAIMGTSTCHVLNGEALAPVPGMCGVVDGGIVPGLYGYEAGQNGVGDMFAWFVDHLTPPEYHRAAATSGQSLHDVLSTAAATQRPGEHGLMALDWWNGNRSVLVDADLSGLLVGATLRTTAPDVYRALVESTAYGARTIIENFEAHGVPVEELVISGGLTRNPFVMQTYADVTGRPLSIARASNGPALGSAIHAAVAAGAFPDIVAAAEVMGGAQPAAYVPNPAAVPTYDRLFAEYVELHDHFGRGASGAMHRLRAIAHEAAHGASS